MARRSALLAFLATTLMLLFAAPAAAAESLEIRPDGCGQVIVTGSGLPAGRDLTLLVSDGFSGKALKSAAVTTDADGAFQTTVPVPLRGLAAVGAEAREGERILLGATHNLDATLRAQCGGAAGAGSLPFTGPTQAYVLLAIGVGLLGVGGLMSATFAYRGRH